MIESEMARGVWLSPGEAESSTLREALERYHAEIVPQKKCKVQDDSIIRMLLTLRWPFAPWRPSVVPTSPACAMPAGLRPSYRVAPPGGVVSHVFSVARKEWGMESLSNPVELAWASPPPIMRVCGVW